MHSSFVFATALACFAGQGLADIYIGGYSGLFEAGPIGAGSLDTLVTRHMASRGAELRFNVHRIPFQDDYNDIGEVLYNWCDIEFTVPGHFGDITLVMGGDNRCGEACDEEDECVEVTHFAELFDADTEELVGECYYDPSWVENCVSDGSLIYSSRVRCSDVTPEDLCDALSEGCPNADF